VSYIVDLIHRPAADDEIRADAIALLSAVAEDSFYVTATSPRTATPCGSGSPDEGRRDRRTVIAGSG
jgi:hypothetical protein